MVELSIFDPHVQLYVRGLYTVIGMVLHTEDTIPFAHIRVVVQLMRGRLVG